MGLSLSRSELIKVCEDEVNRFESYSTKRCKKLAGQLRDALLLFAVDKSVAASITVEPSGEALRDMWVELLHGKIAKMREKQSSAQSSVEPNSVVGRFIRSQQERRREVPFHPGGESDEADGEEYSVSSVSSDEGTALCVRMTTSQCCSHIITSSTLRVCLGWGRVVLFDLFPGEAQKEEAPAPCSSTP